MSHRERRSRGPFAALLPRTAAKRLYISGRVRSCERGDKLGYRRRKIRHRFRSHETNKARNADQPACQLDRNMAPSAPGFVLLRQEMAVLQGRLCQNGGGQLFMSPGSRMAFFTTSFCLFRKHAQLAAHTREIKSSVEPFVHCVDIRLA